MFTVANSIAANAYPAVDVAAGPIWSNADANIKCPKVCSTGLQWNKQWRTTEYATMSVCGTTIGVDVPVGPIWNNDDAKKQCPAQLKKVAWTGQWKTIRANVMSVCGCAVQITSDLVPGPIAAAWMYMADDHDNYRTIPREWSSINFKNVDVLNVGPAGVQADGTFGFYRTASQGDLADRFKWIIKTARAQNPKIKIIVSQWWGNGQGIWGSPLSELKNDAAVTKYTESVGAFLRSYLNIDGGVDGFDVDYEANNVVKNIPAILSQIRSKMNALTNETSGRPFLLSVSPATTTYLDAVAPSSLNFINMQTYAGGTGLTPQSFIQIGLTARQLLYGICPETNCFSKTAAQVKSEYTQSHLAGIHLWRLNSDNYIKENQVQEDIYKFLHP